MISSVPIYDYRCEHCGHAFSALQAFTDDALAKCPNCGKQPRRLIAPPAIVFKGSGWYKTDSRPKPASESGATGAAKPDTKSDTKSDTTKSETKPSAATSGTGSSPATGAPGKGEAAS